MQVDIFNKPKINAKPFLKWAGGKSQLIPTIEEKLPEKIKKTRKIKHYFEPFIGAGAVFFYLISNYEIEKAYISDINKELILCYNIIKNKDKDLINILSKIEKEYLELNQEERKKYYLNIREKYNKQLKNFKYTKIDKKSTQRVAHTIFMNKTGFNGLFRVNKKGEFNVPFGKYKNPTICNKENIENIHLLLSKHEK